MNNKIITLGPEGSYSSMAAKSIFPEYPIDYGGTNTGVIERIPYHLAGVCPIHNKYGSTVLAQLEAIYGLYRLNPETFKVLGTHRLGIDHVLAGLEGGASKEELEIIYSHPQALLQCREELEKLNATTVASKSTTSKILEITNKEAVICSKESAIVNGLKILDESMAPKDNKTEFAVITTSHLMSDNCKKLNGEMKIAILSTLDKIGGLGESLCIIAAHGINAKTIHSHSDLKGGTDFPLLLESIEGSNLKSLHKELGTRKSRLNIF